MATDKTETWSLGESVLWYTPTSSLDATWSLGESFIFDEPVAPASGLNIKLKVSGSWKSISSAMVKVGGSWKSISSLDLKVSGAWKGV